MSKRLKLSIWLASTAVILVNVMVAYNWPQYPHLIFGYLNLGSLLVSAVSLVMWLLDGLGNLTPKVLLVKIIGMVAAIPVYFFLYLILGFMAIGLANGQGGQ